MQISKAEKIMELGRKSPLTIKNYLSSLHQLSRFIKTKEEPSQVDLSNFLLSLKCKPNSILRHFYAAKYYYGKVLHRELDPSFFDLPARDRPGVDYKIKYLEKPEICRLINSISSQRDKAIFALLYDAGLRIGELAALDKGDIDFDRKVVRIRKPSYTKKKGGVVNLTDKTLGLIKDYLTIRKSTSNALFCGLENHRICSNTVRKALKRYCKTAFKKESKQITPHGLRHSRATQLAVEGTPVDLIADHLRDMPSTVWNYYRHMLPGQVKASLPDPWS
jgi:integrase